MPGGAARAGRVERAGGAGGPARVHAAQLRSAGRTPLGQVGGVQLGETEPMRGHPLPAHSQKHGLVAHVHQQAGLTHCQRHRAEC